MSIYVELDQNSDAWFQEKLGKPSASNASKILTSTGKVSTQREGYLYELAAERITGRREETYVNLSMVRGQELEDESRKLYELIHGVEVKKGGVIYQNEEKKFLCSPDGIINNEYGLELKNPLPKNHIKYLLDGEVPTEYYVQVQFSLFVSGFPYWDFMSHSAGLKPLIVRETPDEVFQRLLKTELDRFCSELDELVKKLT